MNGTNNTLLQSYVWGLDLSGTQTGAGVVGELVMMTIHTGTNAGTYLPAYDGNGNVSALVNASNGEVTANYEYGPFGEPIRVSGTMSKENPYRFSTKRTVDSIDIILYEYRAYSPSLGRWLSRNPIGEDGGMNLYGFVNNNLIISFDTIGLIQYLPQGTILKVKVEGGGNVTINVGSQFSSEEKNLDGKALCLVRKLLGRSIYYPNYPDTYWATFNGLKINGISDPLNLIFIDVSSRPNDESALNPMINFGIVLAHEADHYWTSSHDKGPQRPEVTIDIPVQDNANKALSNKIHFTPCNKHNPIWWIENLLEQYACECDINLGTKKYGKYR